MDDVDSQLPHHQPVRGLPMSWSHTPNLPLSTQPLPLFPVLSLSKTWGLVLWDMSPLLPRIAGFLNKAFFPLPNTLSLRVEFLSNRWLNPSSVTPLLLSLLILHKNPPFPCHSNPLCIYSVLASASWKFWTGAAAITITCCSYSLKFNCYIPWFLLGLHLTCSTYNILCCYSFCSWNSQLPRHSSRSRPTSLMATYYSPFLDPVLHPSSMPKYSQWPLLSSLLGRLSACIISFQIALTSIFSILLSLLSPRLEFQMLC